MAEQNDGPVEKDGVVYVPIKLSNPLSREQAERLRPMQLPENEDEGFTVGDTIYLLRAEANGVIDAGYAQVDPEDRVAVRSSLFLNERNQPLTMDEIKKAKGDADAAVAARVEKMQSAADAPSSETGGRSAKSK